MNELLIFDLDGTISDPKEGITRCVQYALRSFGIKEELDHLTPFIGPPLIDSFMRFYGLDLEQAKLAVEKYRERFGPIGKYENVLYPGMARLLTSLKKEGFKLAIGSSKPETYVRDILEYFKILDLFDIVVGSELNGERIHKKEIIEEIFHRNGKKEAAIMIGDRKFDIEGAHQMRIPCIAVEYGYAQEGELERAKPDRIARSVADLENQIKDLADH